jgi:hypothetical protein
MVTSIDQNIFLGCTALETVNIPAATSIGYRAFGYTGSQALTITLGSTAPTLGTDLFNTIDTPKTVTVKRPASAASAYGPSPTDTTTDNWGNAFRGRGWNGTAYLGGEVNENINLIIEDSP